MRRRLDVEASGTRDHFRKISTTGGSRMQAIGCPWAVARATKVGLRCSPGRLRRCRCRLPAGQTEPVSCHETQRPNREKDRSRRLHRGSDIVSREPPQAGGPSQTRQDRASLFPENRMESGTRQISPRREAQLSRAGQIQDHLASPERRLGNLRNHDRVDISSEWAFIK